MRRRPPPPLPPIADGREAFAVVATESRRSGKVFGSRGGTLEGVVRVRVVARDGERYRVEVLASSTALRRPGDVAEFARADLFEDDPRGVEHAYFGALVRYFGGKCAHPGGRPGAARRSKPLDKSA